MSSILSRRSSTATIFGEHGIMHGSYTVMIWWLYKPIRAQELHYPVIQFLITIIIIVIIFWWLLRLLLLKAKKASVLHLRHFEFYIKATFDPLLRKFWATCGSKIWSFIFFLSLRAGGTSKYCNLIGSESGRFFTILPANPGGMVGSFNHNFVCCLWMSKTGGFWPFFLKNLRYY